MKCSNCDKPALWVYESAASDDLPFCEDHLPRFLRGQAASGGLRKTEEYARVQAEVLSSLAPEEPVIEEVVEEVVEEPVPAPKRNRKAAAEETTEEG